MCYTRFESGTFVMTHAPNTIYEDLSIGNLIIHTLVVLILSYFLINVAIIRRLQTNLYIDMQYLRIIHKNYGITIVIMNIVDAT